MTELRVQLVAPGVWQPLMAIAQFHPVARALVSALHARHIGITPDLAARLVPALTEPDPRALSEPWRSVIERLSTELAGQGAHSLQAGPLLASAPSYAVQRLIAPLLVEACEAIGACFLFAADAVDCTVTATDYAIYARALEDAVGSIAARGTEESADRRERSSFWYEPAATLVGRTRARGRLDGGLPALDPLRLGLLLRLRLYDEDQRSRRRRARMPNLPKRPVSRPRPEGGYSGIQLSRREEAIHTMLLSEFANAELIRLDRMLNTGYLALKREPQFERLRDVLLVALVPWPVRTTGGGDVAQACWFEAQLRLSVVLWHHALRRSEFRWIEGDCVDHIRSCSYLLQDLPGADVEQSPEPSEGFRDAFLQGLRWLPSFLDTRDQFAAPIAAPTNEPGVARLVDWSRNAWQLQRDSAGWSSGGTGPSGSGRRLAVGEFAFIHGMVLLPAQLRPDGDAGVSGLLGQLAGMWNARDQRGRRLSITWVPERVDDWSAWRFDAPGQLGVGLRRPRSDDAADTVAAQLIDIWAARILEELAGA